jgi:hypothetical protein
VPDEYSPRLGIEITSMPPPELAPVLKLAVSLAVDANRPV